MQAQVYNEEGATPRMLKKDISDAVSPKKRIKAIDKQNGAITVTTMQVWRQHPIVRLLALPERTHEKLMPFDPPCSNSSLR